jgi:endonuclease YncB( thermonuclease family)
MPRWKKRRAPASLPSAPASRSTRGAGRLAAGLLSALLAMAAADAAARSLDGFARVTDAGHLIVDGQTVALAGIDVPTFDRTCRRTITPVRCAPRAVLILDDLVDGFVHCETVGRRTRGLEEARCTVAGKRLLDERIDLAEELLRQGWAFARADAPGFYRSLERLARTREIGIWADAAIDFR